jgi:8-oxo-dGTP diphosphatase
MNREYPDRPFIGVGAIIIEEARVLLVKRGHAPLAGEWSIPGGVLELGETVRECVVREALEETGLTVEALDLLGIFDRIVRDLDERTLYHYVLIDFFCRPIAGEARSGGDADEVRWFTQNEAAALSLSEDTLEVIGLGFSRALQPPLTHG